MSAETLEEMIQEELTQRFMIVKREPGVDERLFVAASIAESDLRSRVEKALRESASTLRKDIQAGKWR